MKLTQNSFVPSLNSEDSSEVFSRKLNYRNKKWESIIRQQFQLAYFGRVSYSDSQVMPVFEREFLFNLLIEQKDNEAKEIEKSRKNRANNTNHRSYRR